MSRTVLTSFDYALCAAGITDIGKRREDNQDAFILCPEIGFFAVSDGMGGLSGGKIAAEFVEQSMPTLMKLCFDKYDKHRDIDQAADAFAETVQLMSDKLFASGNSPKRFSYGATFVGCWLLKDKAIFVCLGDSRGYLLQKFKRQPRQITEDQNLAGILVKNGELTREEAKSNPASSRLTAFVGMQSPAVPEVFIMDVHPGDRILLCSDGLYGMVEEREMARLMRASRNPSRVCRKLADTANENGGRDNISAVYIRISA